jgi:hypothetical protein
MIKNSLFSILFILAATGFNGYAADTSSEVKSKLEQELQQVYLPVLEKKFGECGDNPSSCLSLIDDDFMVATLPKKEICFPYTMCGFYHCMENQFHCSEVGVDYFTKLAFPTCSQYEANIKKNSFTDKGVQWIYSVMVCLQKGLVDECILNGNCPVSKDKAEQKKTCDHITEFTLAYHPGCYIKSGVGVCHLPLSDKLAIWKTVNPYMTKREREEAYKVIFECLVPADN